MSSTHEDALQQSRAVMKAALTRLSFYAKDPGTRKLARQALEKQERAYQNGVRRAK